MEKNVKRIFFKEGNSTPQFELEDGSIKRTYIGETLLWLTDDEFKERKQKELEEKAARKWWQFWKW